MNDEPHSLASQLLQVQGGQILARNTLAGSGSPRSTVAATASINPLNSNPSAFSHA
ncbi:hypothetical protein D3C75_1380650 [compost metagenome]